MGIIRGSMQESGEAMVSPKNRTGTNYYTAEGNQDYLLSEMAARPELLAPDNNSLLQPSSADMLQRVRKTAKWSQLYQSGPTFPPKHKVLFINQDDEKASIDRDDPSMDNIVNERGEPLFSNGVESQQDRNR